MEKNIKDYLHYYLGQTIKTDGGYLILAAIQTEIIPCTNYRIIVLNGNHVHEAEWDDKCKLVLRKLESMTKEEMLEVLLLLIPTNMEDKPDYDEHDLVMFYNDNSLMVDGDVAVGANYSCRCYEGQIAIGLNGDINLYDEDGRQERVFNQIAAFHHLLSKGFDLFGLIESGLATEKQPTTLNQGV